MNPALCEGQIEGSIHMGLGYALTEELPCENGMPVTFKPARASACCARATCRAIEVILVEEPEPEGPFGAKGVGEIGLVPTAAAVAGALEAFDGVRRYDAADEGLARRAGHERRPHPRRAPPAAVAPGSPAADALIGAGEATARPTSGAGAEG